MLGCINTQHPPPLSWLLALEAWSINWNSYSEKKLPWPSWKLHTSEPSAILNVMLRWLHAHDKQKNNSKKLGGRTPTGFWHKNFHKHPRPVRYNWPGNLSLGSNIYILDLQVGGGGHSPRVSKSESSSTYSCNHRTLPPSRIRSTWIDQVLSASFL